MSRKSHTRIMCALAALLAATGLADTALAQVISIGDAGEVSVYAGPTLFTDAGAAAIVQAAPAVARSRAAAVPSGDVRAALAQAAARYEINPKLLEAVAWQESRFRHEAVSRRGAVGVMQLMPGTARDLRVDPADMTQNIYGGAAYLGQMLRRYGGDVRLSLAAYNAGPGAVDRHRGVPPFAETEGYVKSILGRLTSQP